jgi:hypothetical protein
MRKEILREKALKHYDDMIQWAETRYFYESVSNYLMIDAIGQEWRGVDCSYCQNFNGDCSRCPLSPGEPFYSKRCCNGLWLKMQYSITWGEWVRNAKLVREFIKENG